MTSPSRGFALHAVMIAIVAVGALGWVVLARIDTGNEQRAIADRRVQALWLARSAVRTQVPASREVSLGGGGTARVRVYGFGGRRFAADVVVPGKGSARVDATFGPDGRLVAISEDWRPRMSTSMKPSLLPEDDWYR